MEKYVKIELDGNCTNTNISGFSVDIIEGLDTQISDFTNSTGYIPTKGDTIYLLPGVNIPRIKLKDLALNLGIRVVRDPEKATAFFSGKSSMGKLTTSMWTYAANANEVLEHVKNICTDEFYIERLETAITGSGATTICSDWQDMRNILSNDTAIDYTSSYIYGIEPEYQDVYNAMQSKPIYHESELLTKINGEDSTVIDDIVYEQLKNMFESTDRDNHVLAMEIMANSHYDNSILYLQMLLSDYSNIISNSHTRNHVNFKSLLSYFGWAPRDLGRRNSDNIIKQIEEKGLLTLDMIKRLYQEYSDDIHRNIVYNDVFQIKEVTINPEYLDKLNITSLNLINPEEDSTLEVTATIDDTVTDELIEAAITNIQRAELKSELIALEEELSAEQGSPEEESNNNQIEKTNGDDFEWF